MRLLFAVLAVLFAAPAVADSAVPDDVVIRGAIEGYIRPNFRIFADATEALKADVVGLCAAPSPAALTLAQDKFRSTVAAFSRIEFVRLGPLGLADRLERLLFWPDSKGIALKQVQAALAAKDATAAEAGALQKKSVAMQGLGALEYLLFGTGNEDLGSGEGAYRCSYAAAITTLVDGLATTIATEWQDIGPDGPAGHMLDPRPDAQDYRSRTEVLEKLAGTLINGTETIRDQRLKPVIGEGGGKPKPKSALFWRSGMTAPALAANFGGLRDFFVAAKYPEALGTTNSWVASSVMFELDNAVRAATALVDPIDKVVGDPVLFAAFKSLVTVTGSLDSLLGTNLATALGLSVGFSQLDGD
ncbi:MAG: peptidase M75, Imelysin [Devosia nanyangense]|uniref:Peptidase M75, Imelysin n=1 Tax=Devosia nanyangense TaxID=1228055 RepID=A0A933L3Z5_9HYPH|nr:peptidase M75, Imelysin [Devosia nanyangense]